MNMLSVRCSLRRLSAALLAFLFILGIALNLSGCHGSEGTSEFIVPEEFDTSRNYEISFWAKNDTNKTQTNIYEKAIRDFEALYPNIKVNLRLYTDYGKIYNDVITNIATNTTPNVCITYPDHIATYITGSSTVAPLDSLLDDERYGLGGSELLYDSPTRGEVIERFLNECFINGTCYAIPYMRSTEACFINKTFVEALGYELPEVLTWDFIWEVSEAALEKDADGSYLVNGQSVMIPFIYKSTDNMMIQYLRQAGADYTTPEGDILLFNDTTKSFLYEISEHTRTGAFSTFKISSYPANFINAGQCIFGIDSTAGSTWIGADAPLSDISADAFVDFETVVMPIPQLDTDNPQMISQGPSMCVFNKSDSQEVLASWLFAQYMLTNEVQIAYAETEGYIPVTSKAQHSAEYQDYLSRAGEDNKEHYDVKIAATKLFLDNIENTFTTAVFNGSTSVRNAAGQLIENVAKSTRRKQTVDESYMEKLFDDVSSLYRLDSITDANNAYAGSSGRTELGPLPAASKVLLCALAGTWVCIIAYVSVTALRKKR